MDRVNQILQNKTYQGYVEKNELAEKDRSFCRHNMGHFLDVARIGRILALEEKLPISSEMIYAAALLHDIGRWKQYQDGTDHERVGALLCQEILEECGFSEEEKQEIVFAISNHRNKDIQTEPNLAGLLYRADKKSRACFACQAEKECNWKADKKNVRLEL